MERTEWTAADGAPPVAASWLDIASQPAFGLEVAWNDPRNKVRPFVVLRFWRLRVQFGWLY